MKWLKKLRTNIKAKLNLMSIAILGVVMAGSSWIITTFLESYLGGYTDPTMTWGFPLVQGFLMAFIVVIIMVYVLKRKNVQ